jgi:hypothetical protein
MGKTRLDKNPKPQLISTSKHFRQPKKEKKTPFNPLPCRFQRTSQK